jgi:hypothetical protein
MSQLPLTFKSATPPELSLAKEPSLRNTEECGYSGKQCFTGSLGRECTLASRIFCDTWNNPEAYRVCTFVRREAMYKSEGISK